MTKYPKEFTIHSYESNRFGNASLTSIFNFLIEIAWEHAQKLDWGFDALKSNNYFWVLSRIYIEIKKYPKWQEKITVQTWPTGIRSIYALREYEVKNEQDEIIIRSGSDWLILDMDTKRIIRPDLFANNFQQLAQPGICRYPEKIKPDVEKNNLNFSPVRFTDLDINQHFNSVKFVERALNSYGITFLNDHEVDKIEVNYLKEGLPEDSIAVSSAKISENEDMVSLIRESDGIDLCAMKITWRKK